MNLINSHFEWAVDAFDMGLREQPNNYTFTNCSHYQDEVDVITNGGANWQLQLRGGFAILMAVSVACLSFVAYTILTDTRLQAHPQPMIAYMCLIEAIINWNALIQLYNPCYVSCYIGFERMLPILFFKTISQA
jgi:hypothetical protein